MELYLDSVNLKEIEEAFKLGTLAGLTTTPTFMHREGVKDVDAMILKLAGIVPVLQVEALGKTAEEVLREAERLIALGLNPKTTVFKIPVSLEGIRACKLLRNQGLLVNVHLIYTLQQAYMAANAGATYACPLVGRLQDQGHDALALIEQCVDMIEVYNYDTKIMFSSVRTAEHVRNAINIGVHTITVPWSILKKLTDNNFTELGTKQFYDHTLLITTRVGEVIRSENPIVHLGDAVLDASLKMTESGLGAVSVVEANGDILGIFTDGNLRRALKENGKSLLDKKMSDFTYQTPLSVQEDDILEHAVQLIKQNKVDNLVVLKGKKPVGMLDVQDLIKLDILG
jgi:TalC/MipB family fructose-6-phosphate aldolase